MLKAEWLKIFKTRKMLISVIAILFIPVLYSGMFLWAFWDPYANLNSMPVAILNEDNGVTMEGEQLTLGDEVTKKLIESKQFHFIEVDADKADEQLKNQEYYILIKIPENFSQHATTLLDENPEKLTIEYIPNEGYNFLGAQIGDTAMERVKSEVNTQVSKTYAEKLFTSITELGDGVIEAADGAGKIDDGAQKVTDGAEDLQGYLEQLAASTIELSDGSKTLQEGMQSAAVGSSQLLEGIKQLQNGTSPLMDGANAASVGAKQLQQGVTDYTNGVAQLSEGQKSVTAGGQELATNLQLLANGTENMDDKIASLAEGSEGINSGIEQLTAALQPVLANLPEANKQELLQTLAQLQAGSSQVSNGLGQLKEGTVDIDDNIAALSQGATNLNEGHLQVSTGIEQLALIQQLVSVMGDPGRFVAILILILQLTTSAGTFPLELVPSQLHVFNAFLPMTFSVQAFKAAISTGDTSFLIYNWSILGIYAVVCLGLSLGYFTLLVKKRYSRQANVEQQA